LTCLILLGCKVGVVDGVVDVAEDVDVEAVNGNQSPVLDVL